MAGTLVINEREVLDTVKEAPGHIRSAQCSVRAVQFALNEFCANATQQQRDQLARGAVPGLFCWKKQGLNIAMHATQKSARGLP